MREPRPIKGARAPLFERLADSDAYSGASRSSKRVLDSEALRESVRLEIARLLNTRCALRGTAGETAEGTVLAYGVPDFSALSPASTEDRARLADAMARRIAAYEPRVSGVEVVLGAVPGNPVGLTGAINLLLRVGSVYEPVTFALAVDRLGAGAETIGSVSVE